MTSGVFIPGLELSRAFFREIVRPLLAERFPDLRYSAALLGSGSEVLGFDTEMSTDHSWGPRVDLYLEDDTPAGRFAALDAALREHLPHRFCGYSVSFSPPDASDNDTSLPDDSRSGPVHHAIGLTTPSRFMRAYLGFDPRLTIEPADWLTIPSQKLRTIAAGAVFQDDLGLEDLRARLSWYPQDVWLLLLAASWTRIGQEEHLMGRAGSVGDEIGSSIIGARLVRDVMRLAFLMERQYAPYAKWFGTAFRRLRCATELSAALEGALRAHTWQDRERHLVSAYEIVARMHNDLGITEALPTETRAFFSRPFRVIALQGYQEAIVARIEDPVVKRLTTRPLIGSIDQFSDSTDVVDNPSWRDILRQLYT